MRRPHLSLLFCCFFVAISGCTRPLVNTNNQHQPSLIKNNDVSLTSLSELSIEELKKRTYQSTLKPLMALHDINTVNEYTTHFFKQATPYYSAILGYQSEGLALYSRLDIPSSPAPETGYPVVVFVHGWVGLEKAAAYDFNYNTDSNYADVIHQFVQSGFVVLTPGLRGHGTVNGKVAQGTDFIETWDNGSYISPLFYSLDVLNLLSAINSIEHINWSEQFGDLPPIAINENNVNIFGHSQGGDVVLTTLAVVGENAQLSQQLQAGSIWAGCFLPRFEQLALYGPMGATSDAFLAGDKTWTASAIGLNGSKNPNFVYPYPADWIITPDNRADKWTWQKDVWSTATVKEAVTKKLEQMYQTFNQYVSDINHEQYSLSIDKNGKLKTNHSKSISQSVKTLDAFNYPQYLTEKIALHHSDRDYYSPSQWNAELANRINAIGGTAEGFSYLGNTHSMKISEHLWFSPEGSKSGFNTMMERTIKLFLDTQPPNNNKALSH
jgi:dienelactone hydrolase